jgi:murein L,D-transpeptidase YafK
MLSFALVLMLPVAASHEGPSPATLCREGAASIVVNLKAHELTLCDAGRSVATYAVAIGKGGVGKRAQGDNKTPVGRYALGEPRASGKFGIFIPVGYPTAQQKEQGFTGDNVGIHGPLRGLAWAGAINTWIDWTQGCVAVAHDEDIGAIAVWVKEHRAEVVELVD